MTPTPREVPVWPHRPTTNWSDTSAESVCIACRKPWGDKGCPSQQYLDGLVAAVRALPKWDHNGPGCRGGGYSMIENDFGLYLSRAAVIAILEGARATDDEGRERG